MTCQAKLSNWAEKAPTLKARKEAIGQTAYVSEQKEGVLTGFFLHILDFSSTSRFRLGGW